jgi:hypothetical protein
MVAAPSMDTTIIAAPLLELYAQQCAYHLQLHKHDPDAATARQQVTRTTHMIAHTFVLGARRARHVAHRTAQRLVAALKCPPGCFSGEHMFISCKNLLNVKPQSLVF